MGSVSFVLSEEERQLVEGFRLLNQRRKHALLEDLNDRIEATRISGEALERVEASVLSGGKVDPFDRRIAMKERGFRVVK